MKDRLLIIGPTGLPKTGRRTCTVEAVAVASELDNLDLTVVDTSPGERRWLGFAKKQIDVVIVFAVLAVGVLCCRPIRLAYLAVNDRFGLIFDVQIAIILRVFFIERVTLHHHSRRYCIKKNFFFTLLNAIWHSRRVSHVVQCGRIGDELRSLYNIQGPIISISNLYCINVIGNTAECIRREGQRDDHKRVGLISNLSVDKGVLTFIEAAKRTEALGVQVRFELAGPIADDAIRRVITDADKAGLISYMGPLYDKKKADWLESLDIFFFPTTYPAETEGIVVVEALVAGAIAVVPTHICVNSYFKDAGRVYFLGRNASKYASDFLKFLEVLGSVERMDINIQDVVNERDQLRAGLIDVILHGSS